MKTDITEKQMQYLLQLYHIEQTDRNTEYIAITDLASCLNDTTSNAGRVIGHLRDTNLIEHKRYYGIKTSKSGKLEALKYLHRQRSIESFLVNVMDFEWHQVHNEARLTAAAVTDPVLERMWIMAGSPEFSPFGEPIPDKEGNIAVLPDFPLSGAEIQQTYKISRIMTRLPDRLEYLKALGLIPDAELQLLNHAPFQGPLQIQLGREYRIIGHSLADLILVMPLSTE